MPVLESPFAQLRLIRQPEQQNEPLQAFDAADEYLLNHLAEQGLPANSRVLVLNDSFGALAISLVTTMHVTSSSDSFLAIQALESFFQGQGKAGLHILALARLAGKTAEARAFKGGAPKALPAAKGLAA